MKSSFSKLSSSSSHAQPANSRGRIEDFLRRLIHETEGTTAVEYCVMLALILVVIIAGITAVGGGNNGWWEKTNNEFETHGF